MAISKLNTILYSTIDEINTIPVASIDQINTIDAPSGFATDYSLSLNGTNQYVNLGTLTNSVLQPTQSSINTTGFTMSAWVYFPTGSPTDYVINLGQSGTNNYYGLKINVNTSRYVVVHVMGLNGSTPGAGTNNRNSIRTSSTIPNNSWKHIAAVFPIGSMGSPMERTSWKIYINGVQQSIGALSGNQNVNLTYTGTSQIGAQIRTSAQNFYSGQINNTAVWAQALTTSNLAAVYNSGTPIDLSTNAGNYNNSAKLIAWWRFNEGTGTSYTDSDNGQFTGAGVNTPTWSTNVP